VMLAVGLPSLGCLRLGDPPGVSAVPTGLALLWLRWLAGLIGLPILLLMSRLTLEIPNTQSATGILYVACLAVILGELTAQLLGMTAKVESPVAQPAQQKIWSKSTA